jgi:hypothetical protein
MDASRDIANEFDRRQGPRRTLRVTGSAMFSNITLTLRTIDVSCNGMSVASDMRLPAGKSFQLSFRLPMGGHAHLLNIPARAVNDILTPADGFRTGLIFVSTTAEQDRLLRHYLHP